MAEPASIQNHEIDGRASQLCCSNPCRTARPSDSQPAFPKVRLVVDLHGRGAAADAGVSKDRETPDSCSPSATTRRRTSS